MANGQIDLLAWPHVHAAQLRLVQAEAQWREAERRYRFAPHGHRDSRLEELRVASAACLAAEIAFNRIVEEACC